MTTDETVALVVFTRDLRVADHPALTRATQASKVVCAFIHDDALRSGRPMHPLRTRFLSECLANLDASLRRLGSRLKRREGELGRRGPRARCADRCAVDPPERRRDAVCPATDRSPRGGRRTDRRGVPESRPRRASPQGSSRRLAATTTVFSRPTTGDGSPPRAGSSSPHPPRSPRSTPAARGPDRGPCRSPRAATPVRRRAGGRARRCDTACNLGCRSNCPLRRAPRRPRRAGELRALAGLALRLSLVAPGRSCH